MVKLSVIVPFYNVQEFAQDMLRSLALNARSDFEFVLVDDCSTDRTPEILEHAALGGGLPGARLIRHRANAGLATARNSGLDAAEGEYLAFLDGDDWLAPGYLPRLLAAIERLGCDFVRTDHVQATGRERVVHRVPHGLRNVVLPPRAAILPADRATCVDYPYAWAGMYHRRLKEAGLLHFTDGLRTAEDRPWIWRLHREADSFAVLGLLGVFYRRGVATSLTQIGDVRQLDFIRAFDQVLADTAADPRADELLPKAVRTYCAIISHHLAGQDRFQPHVARRLRSSSARALRRMPQDLVDSALDAMDLERAAVLRRLRRPAPLRGPAVFGRVPRPGAAARTAGAAV
ncbi:MULTISPECIES: glycosyltransferase family 2 protein [Streptomycetaceae]|uniref:Transferase n=1 Tax=Streptantibioticus cattleyicolor (strain ATCC 35852 / DSM 46488 / JCM 4925 / NBRC 14057 / NRRL 8057) TaxID=1003195 RepID=F8K0E1_STREN|nr:glycosyltransferase family 2 protein [Streptantibioticus cattleyicolor]AEW96130.1 transferase [Streptantibioticus cattleyicolor NRRL 8057 = DSM 46488]MYS60659.1 glycosyltransferase [Streptomyces sp. SID5468]CCB76468.1 putative glycosyltransferase, secreted [Streptantibioticus cattleyicolor NRRL 8057 = DSM 46488]